MMYSLDEVGLIPTVISDVKSRKKIIPYINDKLPIFVAPMTCILSETNIRTFNNSKVIPIFPVWNNVNLSKRILMSKDTWVAVTLNEYEKLAHSNAENLGTENHILLDVADGHMSDIFDLTKLIKSKHPTWKIMIGNIANPDTYFTCCDAGVDYVRLGIGGGSGCLTSVLTGFHASIPWLLGEIKKGKSERLRYAKIEQNSNPDYNIEFPTKIIADGGINTIDRAIKALALGADYVMMGRCFAETEEACSNVFVEDDNNEYYSRKYYGQASEKGQIDRFGKVKGHIEGCSIKIEVKYSLSEFCDKFEDVLRTAMSYQGAFTLNEFIGKVKYEYQSFVEFNNYNK